MTSREIREKFLKFFEKKGHSIIPSSSLVPKNDPTSLFIGSGMQPLISYLTGEKHPEGKRLVNSQKCLRMEDIDEVGNGRHTTYFEMLGNWSLGDYFKKEQLNWCFEFLVEELKLDINKLYSTIFKDNKAVAKDNESLEILKNIYKKYGVNAEEKDWKKNMPGPNAKIFAYSSKKNWWMRSNAIGELGGPDSEIFYDTDKKHNLKYGKNCHLNCDCGKFIEIGNSVFIQYKKIKNGWENLPIKNVDFGGGLERITMIKQGKKTLFETDLFLLAIQKIQELSNKKYGDNENNNKSFEIIADHLRAAIFILADHTGITPSNVDQGYIIRRLIRRAIRQSKILGINNNFIKKIANTYITIYKDIYSELEENKEFLLDELEKEENKFRKTLEIGLREFEKKIIINAMITGKEAFNMYQTYGFPIEMTKELAREKGLKVNEKEFKKEFEKHQKLSRTAAVNKFKGGLADAEEQTIKLHTATHLLHQALREVLGQKISQKGSNITLERLRFDFSHPQKMTSEEIKKVENIVNKKIKKNLPVVCKEMTLKDAKKKGAIGVFDQKYGEKVKVYSIPFFSQEICNGPHVNSTSELGKFKILKEESVAAGTRRIKAIIN